MLLPSSVRHLVKWKTDTTSVLLQKRWRLIEVITSEKGRSSDKVTSTGTVGSQHISGDHQNELAEYISAQQQISISFFMLQMYVCLG